VRWLSPLNISREQAQEALDIMRAQLDALQSQLQAS
jgi:4-aminobutyrate aminotransferase-like enzyme